ncbi:5'-methylthioadenosine nucleosidase [Photobacterium profundum]|uniref:Putative MTA/SAH nucleosidase n=1 Tax=Photobacterium profundum 3TCK TaxID=314280 RepID=Q1ZB99_9GAMM|nr:5'-methylthioadenosine/S-adenosylhomocysteine nucleosidase [Photobacterium profundum]EAS45243.1 putative MTA/SAH nucleosidase [Photobacterium profundum 3TCK]PSV63555.1 5'-methylthioadenosine nucleosidase [Photobacterium profundum]
MFAMPQKLLVTLFILLFTSFATASTMKSVSVPSHTAPKQPILIQGPMPIEAEYFAGLLSNVKIESTGNFTFYIGDLNGYPIVVTQTSKGVENTAAATAVAIERYNPRAIINQGTSGGHDKSLNVGDIVLGKRSVNVGNLKTPITAEGQGSDPFNWIPMDVMASSGSAGESSDAEKIRYYEGSPELLAAAHAVKDSYKRGKVVEGTIGSANFWNNEIDRMNWLHKNFGTSVEEMETASAALIAEAYQVPFLGIRVLSNNLTNGGKYDPTTAKDNQEFVKNVVVQYISTLQ